MSDRAGRGSFVARGFSRASGLTLVAVALAAAVAAPLVAPYTPQTHFDGLLNAPPTAIHVADDRGGWHAPFVYPWRLVSQLEQRYEEDRQTRVPIAWLSNGHLIASSNVTRTPVLLLGADSFGRDVFSRLLFGARISLSLAALAAVSSMLIGASIGGIAGYVGGPLDDGLMRGTDFVMVLPAMYVALALRSVLPLVLAPFVIFVLLAVIFAVVGAPFVARGVRAIVRTERQLEYAFAAQALGASPARLLVRHLLPATRGFLVTEVTLLVPAFIVAEATLSFVGLGFPESMASWGTMLHEASNIRAFADFPWLLSPAAAIFLVVFGLNLAMESGGSAGVRYERPM